MSRPVSELAGADLALWVARAEGLDVRKQGMDSWIWIGGYPNGVANYITGRFAPRYAPHEDWAQGGPLIEKHKISIKYCSGSVKLWQAETGFELHVSHGQVAFGPTSLIAAMRALVASVYRETVPDEVVP